MKINKSVLENLDIDCSYVAMSAKWVVPYFSTEFIVNLRKEVLRKINLVNAGIYELTFADILSINFFNDLCFLHMNDKLIIEDDPELTITVL